MLNSLFIQPHWPAPATVRAFCTLRQSETSLSALHLPSEPIWLKQIHSQIAIPASEKNRDQEADASYTDQINTVCVVRTADCLPILICNQQGTYVSAIHGGWRGLQQNIIDNTLNKIPCRPEDLMVWLGPAIGPKHFEVGGEVRDLFISMDKNLEAAFKPFNQRWLCDIYTIAKIQLTKRHVTHIYGGDYCTYSDPEKFYSYRRDGANTGRMASLIWINSSF